MRELTMTDILTVAGALLLCLAGMAAWAAGPEIRAWLRAHRATAAPLAVLVVGILTLSAAGWPGAIVAWLLGVVCLVTFARPLGYVTQRADDPIADDPPFSPFERAERPLNVQPERTSDDAERADEAARIDVIARQLAAGMMAGEAALIEVAFPGVKRGGSKRYTELRDAVRARAQQLGWQPKADPPAAAPPAAPHREIAVYAGRPNERRIEYDDPALNYAEPPRPA